MKYIKTFEDIDDLKYRVGDYVLLDIDEIIDDNIKNNGGIIPFKFAQIIGIISRLNAKYPYKVDYYDGDEECYVREIEIIRKLTPDEIDGYEMIKNSKKYNL